MNPVSFSIGLFEAERQLASERPKNVNDQSDFEGVITATWQRLTNSGLGEVVYGNKVYKTVPLGTRSIKRGTKVLVNFAKGIYYSIW